MKSLLNKTANYVAGVVLFCVGCVIAGLGLSVVALLAMVAMVIAGLALLTSPFVALAHRAEADEQASQSAATTA